MKLKDRVEELERKVKELDTRPPVYVYPPVYIPQPYPAYPYPYQQYFVPYWYGQTWCGNNSLKGSLGPANNSIAAVLS